MKRLHIITLAVLAASVLALGVTTLVRSIGNDKTIPEIVCSDTPLRLSVQDGEAGLLQDVRPRPPRKPRQRRQERLTPPAASTPARAAGPLPSVAIPVPRAARTTPAPETSYA